MDLDIKHIVLVATADLDFSIHTHEMILYLEPVSEFDGIIEIADRFEIINIENARIIRINRVESNGRLLHCA